MTYVSLSWLHCTMTTLLTFELAPLRPLCDGQSRLFTINLVEHMLLIGFVKWTIIHVLVPLIV